MAVATGTEAGEAFADYLARVRAFTQEVLRPHEAALETELCVPEAIVAEMRELGLFAITLPRDWGGLGWTMEEQVLLTMEFTQASAAYRARFSTTIGLCAQVVLDYGTEAQKQRFLPEMASGRITAAFALTEEEAGSDAGSLKTRAARAGNGYRIDGSKRYITNAPDADLFVVMARTGAPQDGHAGISVFLVERETPGVSVGAPEALMGQAGSRVAEIQFDDCRVPGDALLGGQEGNGLKIALRGINHARTHVAATAVGQAIRLIEEMVAYAKGREQFGQPIAEFQAVQTMIGESQAELSAARALTLDVARRFDAGPVPFTEIACAKLFATEMVCRVADRAVQVLGGMGYMTKHAVSRLYRDVRLLRIYEGTSQIHQLNIARRVLAEGGPIHG